VIDYAEAELAEFLLTSDDKDEGRKIHVRKALKHIY
jgi:hypothetical protein